MNFLIVNITGAMLIILTLWWFFGSKARPKVLAETDSEIHIRVKDGIYQPAQIQIPAGKTITLRFLRQDPTPCAEYVLFAQLNLSYQLPLNEEVKIIIPPQSSGEIDFTCQMGMYRGRLIVI